MKEKISPIPNPNPWGRLPTEPPYVSPQDRDAIVTFNGKARLEHFLHLHLIPEPFLGRPDAPVVLLGLNPGYHLNDDLHHRDPVFIERSRDNLVHRPSAYPFFLLDPAITAPGNKWWMRKLGALIRQFGLETVAQKVLCVEYFPYHSCQFGHRKLNLF